MTTFIENVNKYLAHYKIKNSFLVKMTKIEKNKLSRLLTEKQNVQLEDMEAISKALSKNISYFMQETLGLQKVEYKEDAHIAFYMGEVDEKKKALANDVFDFLENVDAILGFEKKMKKKSLVGISDGI